jgi:cyclopropane-fatty-acyl-phospholipid synthase
MGPLIQHFLRSLIRFGALEVETADGEVRVYGDGSAPHAGIKIKDRAAELALMLDPALAMGELFMDGRVEVTKGDLYDVLAIGARNLANSGGPFWLKWIESVRRLSRRFHPSNNRRRARRNVERHYDLNVHLYDLFLDADRQYSCAYFEHPDDSLDQAQLAKKRHLAAKLLVEEGQRVLDIGCGFGGLALYMAEMAGADVTGVTLSREQFAVATKRAADTGLGDLAHFALKDYRDVEDSFDRIVSVGMFEHVGVAHYDEFFANARRLLKDDGVMILHAIGRSSAPSATNPWIEKHIFPGGYIPSLSEVLAAIERAGLLVTDTEILRLHYAETLKSWRERFMARRDEAKAMYDERFCRMWEFYLAGSESSFRVDGHMVFQIQLAKQQNIVPLTRDYVAEREARLRKRESQKPALRLAGE